MANCALYHGRIEHHRYSPFRHSFTYRLFNVYLDLVPFERANPDGWSWPSRVFAWASYRRADHLGPPDQPLSESVRALVAGHLGGRPMGPIRMLTHLRYWGYVINPVSFYYCFDAHEDRLAAIVAEVQNTPWNERHCYVVDGRSIENNGATDIAKQFHVSPFLEMTMSYRFRFSPPGDELTVAIENWKSRELRFSARLTAVRSEFTRRNLLKSLFAFPWMTGKVFAAIYWQALRLWWKGAEYVPHPAASGPAKQLPTTTS
jgi:DUF1365 family protein